MSKDVQRVNFITLKYILFLSLFYDFETYDSLFEFGDAFDAEPHPSWILCSLRTKNRIFFLIVIFV